MDTRHTPEIVARVMHLAAIAVFHTHQRAVASRGVDIGGQRLRTDLDRRRVAELIIIEVMWMA